MVPVNCRAGRLALFVALLLPAGLAGAVEIAVPEVTPAQLQARIDYLVADIREAQDANGAFVVRQQQQYTVGHTALAIVALRAAGVPENDPAVVRGIEYLRGRTGERGRDVYEKSLQLMALCSVDPDPHRRVVADLASYLVAAQQQSGGWTYDMSGRTDYSNTQYALLGLNAAAGAGVPIPPEVWEKARVYLQGGQNADGGWGYTPRSTPSYGSMTAAGVASLYICDTWIHVNRKRCGVYPDVRPIQGGLNWMSRSFSVAANPGRNAWHFYYLYALERVGVILAQRYFGWHDWYREGAAYLVLNPANRMFVSSGNEWPFLRKCFGLLFLAKGNAPIVIHKASWAGRWNANRYDARFLVQFTGDELGRGLDWQIVPLSAPLDRLMSAPILYLSGSSIAAWDDEERARFRQYTEAGGVVLVEAEGGDRAFDDSFRKMMAQLYPEDELAPLGDDHPIYSVYFNVPAGERPPLEAIKGPCWISVLYAPKGLSCPWDVADFDHVNFKLGMNIIAYVTGLQRLQGKLEKPEFSRPPEDDEAVLRRGAFTVGQVMHRGDWRPHKVAWRRVLQAVRSEAGLEVFSRTVPLNLTEQSPFEAQMLYITGVQDPKLTAQTKDALAEYVERGGFIFAEAACGSSRFDRAFRETMNEIFPDSALRVLPVGHPLYALGRPLGEVDYSQAVRKDAPNLKRPYLEYMERDGRAVVVYSKYDLSSAIDGHPCHSCPSVLDPSASLLVMKIVLYALTS